MLYADSYLTEGDFRDMFDHTLYDRVRRRYGCEDAFPTTYFKVCKTNRK